MATRKRDSAETWRVRVNAWKASGLSAEEFAAREKVTPRTLRWWMSELRRRGVDMAKPLRGRGGRGAKFVSVGVREAEPTNALVELVLAGGHTLRVGTGFDLETVQRLIAAVLGSTT